MRDIFPDGIRILDLLEITGSTATTASWITCDQSSVSRIYRRVSDLLALDFCKEGGRYGARNNLELLHCLRQAAQLLRLDQGPQRLQWVSHADVPLQPDLLSHSGPIPRCWNGAEQTLALLQQRVLDLAVLPHQPAAPPAALRGMAVRPLRSHAPWRVLLLDELSEHASLQRLIAQLEAAPLTSRIVVAADA